MSNQPGSVALNTPPMLPPTNSGQLPSSIADMQRMAEQGNKAISESQFPEMEDSPSLEVSLPGGAITPSGELITTARVREMNGFDEEALARLSINTNVAVYVTELLSRCVEDLGGQKPTKEDMRYLLIGDRDALAIGISKATYGPKVDKLQLTCQKCGEKSDLVIDLDEDVKTIPLKDPKQRTFQVPLKRGSAEIELLLGKDQEEFSKDIGKKTIPEQITELLSLAVRKVNGKDVSGDDALRHLSSADRTTITDFIKDTQPGPDLSNIPVNCATCGEEYPISLGIANLFRF